MRHYRVLVLNAAYYPNNIVDWKDAFNLIFDNKAYVLENYNKTIKTISQEFLGYKNQILEHYSDIIDKKIPIKMTCKIEKKSYILSIGDKITIFGKSYFINEIEELDDIIYDIKGYRLIS
jgi:hypothetical protein